MHEAARTWSELHRAGRITDEMALSRFGGWLGLTLEHIYPDGSVMRWNDREGRWNHFASWDAYRDTQQAWLDAKIRRPHKT